MSIQRDGHFSGLVLTIAASLVVSTSTSSSTITSEPSSTSTESTLPGPSILVSTPQESGTQMEHQLVLVIKSLSSSTWSTDGTRVFLIRMKNGLRTL